MKMVMKPRSLGMTTAAQSIIDPESIMCHVSELAEWTPELAEKLADIKPCPPEHEATMFTLSLTPEQMKRLLPEAFPKERACH